jgi:hypothetical protein
MARRPLLAAAADDNRDPRHRPRVAGGFRQADPLAAVLPGAGLPQGAESPMAASSSSNLARARKWQAEPGVLAPPPARPGCRRTIVRRSARQAWPRSWPGSLAPGTLHGVTSVLQPKTWLQAREQPERHPRLRDRPQARLTCGIWIWDPSARFPWQAEARRRHGPPPPASAPGCRVLIPGKSRQLQHQAHPGTLGCLPLLAGRHPHARGVRGLGLSLLGGCHQVPSLAGNLRGERPASAAAGPPAGAGTGRSRARFRRRHSTGSVSTTTTMAGRLCSWPAPG